MGCYKSHSPRLPLTHFPTALTRHLNLKPARKRKTHRNRITGEKGALTTTMATATRTSKKAIGSISKTATLHVQRTFCTFLCRHFTTTTANSITRRFMEDVNTPRRIFLSPCKLGFGPHEFIYREIKLHLTFLSEVK